jgi:MinD-like ATPase involved in chromosome partitioning or flagellar assembly
VAGSSGSGWIVGTGKIVSIHSYRGGTGKSNTTANLAACLADRGARVAVLDTDLQSPGVHVIFGLRPDEIRLTLVDFLWQKCSITETAYDVTDRIGVSSGGRCWLVPASLTTRAITRIIDEGYDVNRLNAHFDELLVRLELDALLVDTHPGLNRETMLSSAISDVLVLVVRPDQQDYEGTAVLLEVARKLEIPRIFLVANKVFSHVNEDDLKERLEEAFGCEVVGVLPLSEDVARLESRELFVRKHPDHEIAHRLRAVAARIAEA